MSYTEVMYAIGDLSWEGFKVLEAGNNVVNIGLITIGCLFIAYWWSQLVKIGKADKKYYPKQE